MAIKRLVIDGFGQIELNNVAFRRDGRVEAQCALDAEDFASVPAENGMLLAVDKANRCIKFYNASEDLPLAINYSSEHLYDERANALRDFSLKPGQLYPRMGYPAVGDLFTTNTLCYDDTEYTSEEALLTALKACNTAVVYAGASTNGAWKVSATKPTAGVVAKVVKAYTMPDGQFGVKLQILGC